MTVANAYAGRGLHGQIVELLGVKIVQGEYSPGGPLMSESLERDYGVSKTVIREALKVLAAKGMVESRQKRGTVVRPRRDWNLLDSDLLRWQNNLEPDYDFLENLAEVRSIIEPAAARLAATRRTPEDLAALESALDVMAAADSDLDATVVADVLFHRAVLDSAHNELLSHLQVMLEPGLIIRDRFVHADHKDDPTASHRVIFEAIEAGDPDEAARRISELLSQSSSDLADARRRHRKVRKP